MQMVSVRRGHATWGSGLMVMAVWCRLRNRAALLGAALFLALPALPSLAQSVPVLGYVAAKNANSKRLEVFKQGLAELGYSEGKNVKIEYREAVLDGEYQVVMAELLASKANIILAANVAAAVPPSKTTPTPPNPIPPVPHPL